MTDLVLAITEEAQNEMQNMRNHLARIRGTWGESSRYYREAAESLAHIQTQILSMGGKLWRDSELSLGGQSYYGMVYGVVFSKSPYIAKDWEDEYVTEEFYRNMCLAGNTPGVWSMHS